MKKFFSLLLGLMGFSLVIVVHELGHFFACKLFAVPVPLFSIGFGPRLLGYKIGGTLFQIALLPFGGYVAIGPDQLFLQPYLVKIFVLLAGIALNFLFAYIIFLFFRWKDVDIRHIMAQATSKFQQGIVGPVGIVSVIRYSVGLSFTHFLLVLASLSLGVGIFNLLPIPFLDGGQIAWYTIEAIVGKIPETVSAIGSMIFFVLFVLFFVFISIKDIWKLRR